jgi:alkylresorcinol/alkylpyrone synthase
MTPPAILGLATGTPAHRYDQMEIHDRWLFPYIKSHRARAIFAASQIDTRYSVMPDVTFLAEDPGTRARNDFYMETARPLAAEVINRTLSGAGLAATDLDHFIVVSCTGFNCPGLDVLLAGDLGMRPDLRRSALIGMGCHAGLTGLDRAMVEVIARPQNRALVLAVELGTLHFQHGKSLENMVAGALFGDGVAAAIVGPAGDKTDAPRLLDTMTYTDQTTWDLMAFQLSDRGYQIRLATRVPKVLRAMVPDLVTQFLERSSLKQEDIRFWGIHPGGAKIVDYLGQALNLTEEDLRYSRRVLGRYGNMSSVTILFVLDEIIRQGRPQPGDYALLQGFGPGLTVELGLLRWDG